MKHRVFKEKVIWKIHDQDVMNEIRALIMFILEIGELQGMFNL
jgi:hypothetical protein